jgi:hypothetical protein
MQTTPILPERHLEIEKDSRHEILDNVVSKITDKNAKEWVDNHLFADVKIAMKNLIDYIENSGELEKYWMDVD